MKLTPRQAVGIALKRLRFGVTICCWIVGLALGVQIIIWSLVAWTDLRAAEQPIEVFTGPLIVENSPVEDSDLIPLPPPPPSDAQQPVHKTDELAPPQPQRSVADRIMATSWALAAGFGKLMMLLMLPLILVGVLLGAGSATPGIERTVSAFGWGLCVGLLVLPIGEALGLPWGVGALMSYDDVVEAIAVGSLIMYAKHLLLPVVCIAGLMLVGMRFSAGVEAALPEPGYVFDPELERETANIKATSLHGGRGGTALKVALKDEIKSPAIRAAGKAHGDALASPESPSPSPPLPSQTRPNPSPQPAAPTPRANETSPGAPLRRLI